jgi:hypothetical protein
MKNLILNYLTFLNENYDKRFNNNIKQIRNLYQEEIKKDLIYLLNINIFSTRFEIVMFNIEKFIKIKYPIKNLDINHILISSLEYFLKSENFINFIIGKTNDIRINDNNCLNIDKGIINK